jgi:hypothetical protein
MKAIIMCALASLVSISAKAGNGLARCNSQDNKSGAKLSFAIANKVGEQFWTVGDYQISVRVLSAGSRAYLDSIVILRQTDGTRVYAEIDSETEVFLGLEGKNSEYVSVACVIKK